MSWSRLFAPGVVLAVLFLHPPLAVAEGRSALLGELNRLDFYADDAVLLPNNGEKLVGKEAMRKKMLADQQAGMKMESFTGRTEEAWECGGKVYTIETYALSLKVPGMERPVADKGKFIAIWTRGSGGGLKILYDMWNTDVQMGM